MGNATQFLTGVPFHSPTYHILLYGINQIGPKIEEFMESEGNNFALGPKLLWDENGNLPKVLIRRCEALPPDAIDGMIAKSAAMPSYIFSHLTRFIDGNTMQPHYELFVVNDNSYDPEIILLSIISVVHMLRIRGFKFLTPLISSMPYVNIFNNPNMAEIVPLEDVGIGNLDTNNVPIEIEDLDWVYENIPWFLSAKLDGNGEFNLPLEMLYASIFSSSENSKLASLWIGVESLIKTSDSDISKTVKQSLHTFGGLSKRKSWDFWAGSLGRCNVIHGNVPEFEGQQAHIERVNDVRDIFCKMLQYFIENKIVPTNENVSKILNL